MVFLLWFLRIPGGLDGSAQWEGYQNCYFWSIDITTWNWGTLVVRICWVLLVCVLCVLTVTGQNRDSVLSQSCVITQTASSGLVLPCGWSGLEWECLAPELFSHAAVNNCPKGNYLGVNLALCSLSKALATGQRDLEMWMGSGAMAGSGGAAPAWWVCGRTVKWRIESCFWSIIMNFCDVRYLVVFFF